jgi:hypothetical protein
MRLRRPQRDPIGAFWAWWAGAQDQVESSLSANGGGTGFGELTERVQAIDPALEWEIGPAGSSTYRLCVTSAGQHRNRALAERWRLAGPPSDATWSYASARPAAPDKFDLPLQYGAVELDPAEVRFGVAGGDERHDIDLAVHHPAFVELDEATAASIAFLLVDWLLGEDAVERWIGQIEVAVDPPTPLLGRDEVRARVDDLRAANLEPRFAVLRAKRNERTSSVVVRSPLKRVEYPLFDLHGCIEVVYGKSTDNEGMPVGPAKEALQELTDELEAAGGDDVLFAARMTGEGTRTFDVYVDSGGAGRGAIEGVLSQPRWRRSKTTWTLDPEWTELERYRFR